jgi:hypothetical protein
MATFTNALPTGALPCGSGQLSIEAANKVMALSIAKFGGGAYVNAQVEGAAQAALGRSPELTKAVGAMKKVQVLYTLGKTEALPGSAWYFPFQAYAVDRG